MIKINIITLIHFFLIISCVQEIQEDQSHVISDNDYQTLIDEVEKSINENASDMRWIKLKIEVLENKGWPPESEAILDFALKKFNNDPYIFSKKIEFLKTNNKKREMLYELILQRKNGNRSEELQKQIITHLIELNKYQEAKIELNDLMKFNFPNLFKFALDNYMIIGDTVNVVKFANLYLLKNKIDASQILDIIPYFQVSYQYDQGIKLLNEYLSNYPNDNEANYWLIKFNYLKGDINATYSRLSFVNTDKDLN